MTPYGAGGGSSRVRVLDWLRWLQLDAEVHDYLGRHNAAPRALARQPLAVASAERATRALRQRQSGRLLLHREASPFSRGQLERQLLSAADFGVYDFDDALQWDSSGGLIRRIVPKPKKCIAAVRAADRVVAGNDVLADWACGFSHDVIMIPSCVDPVTYTCKNRYIVSDPPLLGWVGSPSTERYLRLVERPLLELHRQTGARLRIISAGAASLGSLDPITERVPWSQFDIGRLLVDIDVSIAPLVDGPYERGKCAYKILQYGASGVPVVGSPVGANQLALARLGGTASTTQDEWFDAILTLLTMDVAERTKIGKHSRSAVQQHYSFAAWASRWRDAVGLDTN
ncbi:glycosyltransferase [Frankia sp. Cj3]|uniref:glycosyltransferase n=1 Tax=Frankia sp. Cj3 TaxID=2880976 RepID=UPI001EF72878|nr:glycosyltransferase [Frankia sp. Cj3]